MRVLLRLLLPPALLILLVGCCPPQDPTAQGPGPGAPPDTAGADPAGDGRDPGSMLSTGGLGKEDYAKIRGELDCVEAHFADDLIARTRAVGAVYRRHGTTPEWVASVGELTSNSPFGGRVAESVTARREQVCLGGALNPDYLALISP